MAKRLYGIRGAVCCGNTADEIQHAVSDMCSRLFCENGLQGEDFVSLHFTMTGDLDALIQQQPSVAVLAEISLRLQHFSVVQRLQCRVACPAPFAFWLPPTWKKGASLFMYILAGQRCFVPILSKLVLLPIRFHNEFTFPKKGLAG